MTNRAGNLVSKTQGENVQRWCKSELSRSTLKDYWASGTIWSVCDACPPARCLSVNVKNRDEWQHTRDYRVHEFQSDHSVKLN